MLETITYCIERRVYAEYVNNDPWRKRRIVKYRRQESNNKAGRERQRRALYPEVNSNNKDYIVYNMRLAVHFEPHESF